MGSDRVPVFLALPNRNFLDLIEDCCHVLSDWRADACQISVLNERAGFQLFTCERSEGMLLSGPSIIAIMLAHRLIEPDNVSTLGLLADIATRPDLNDIIHRYVCKSEAQFVSNQSKRVVQTVDDGT